MKKQISNYRLQLQFLQGGGKLFLASVFFFMLGISAGVFTELMMSTTEKNASISYFNQYFLIQNMSGADYGSLFSSSAVNNLSLFFIIILSCLTAFGFPIALGALIYKGAALGFSASLLIDQLSYKGVAFILTSMVPQNLIIIPVFILLSAISVKLAFHTLQNRRLGFKKSLHETSMPFAAISVFFALLLLVGCFIESFICPFLTQLIG